MNRPDAANAVTSGMLDRMAAAIADAWFERADYPSLFRERLQQYGSYVAEISAALDDESDIV